MLSFDLNLAVGLLGSLMQLAAFALNLSGRIRHDSFGYVGANAFGCVLTAYYAIVTGSIPFLILETVWGAFAFYKLAGLLGKKQGRAKK